MSDFTAGAINGLPIEARSSGNVEFDQRIHDLVREFGCNGSTNLVQEMIVTALKMGRDNLNVADLKLFNRSLKELRYAARVFSKYTDRQKVAVFGSARTNPAAGEFKAAVEFGQKMRESGYMIITGGGDGIMGAAQQGAGRADSFGLNIRLPFEQRANEVIDGDPKLINFNYFFTRKLNFVKETHAVALFPGGFGTMDEGFEVLTLMQTGKARILPVVCVDKPGGTYWKTLIDFLESHLLGYGLVSPEDFNFFHLATDVDDAVTHIHQFYKVFSSYRWVGKKMVIRLKHGLTDEAVERLNETFASTLVSGRIERTAALPEELNQPELVDMPRLVLMPNRHHFGKMRAVIDAINQSETAECLAGKV
jgi:uncharacterized protein (TIGR00730 family)